MIGSFGSKDAERIWYEQYAMEDFIEGFGITQKTLTVSIGASPRRIDEIVHGKRGLRLTRRSVRRGTSGRPRSSG